MYFPISYYKKPTMSYIGTDLTNPTTGTTTGYSNLEVKGEYMALTKFGYCMSNYSMAYRFILGSNICRECMNEYCYSCVKDTECEKCRYSVP